MCFDHLLSLYESCLVVTFAALRGADACGVGGARA